MEAGLSPSRRLGIQVEVEVADAGHPVLLCLCTQPLYVICDITISGASHSASEMTDPVSDGQMSHY